MMTLRKISRLGMITLFMSCLQSEADINKDVLIGTVIVPPSAHEEVSDASNNLIAEPLDMMPWGNTIISGSIAAWGVKDGTYIGDVDTYEFVAERDVSVTINATMLNPTSDTQFEIFVDDLSADGDTTTVTWPTITTTETADTGKTVETADTGKTVETADTGKLVETGDTGKTVETGDTGKTVETGDTGKTVETGDTGKTVDTADTGKTVDTADTGKTVDTADTGLKPPAVENLGITTGLNDAQLTVHFEIGHTYRITIAGVQGSQRVDYELVLPAGHPDDAGIIVGAYMDNSAEPDILNRGNPIGGVSLGAFTLQEDWSYTADYQMFLLRQTVTTEQGEVQVVENFERTLLWAGTWDSLNDELPEQTFYSASPTLVDLSLSGSCDPEVVLPPGEFFCTTAPDISVETIAEAFDGLVIEEFEPNYPKAQSIGLLSGNGYVDTITGDIEIIKGQWLDDWDLFTFQVAEPTILSVGLEWESCETANMDIDIGTGDGSQGNFSILAFSWDQCPETITTETLQPGTDYVVRVYAWEGDGVVPYVLTLEQDVP